MARLLLLLLALLLPLSAAAEGWTAKRLMVYDYTGAAWAPYTTAAIAYYRAHLPRRAPRLVRVPMTGACQEHPGAIAVCEWPAAQMANPGAWGETPLVRVNGTMRQATIRLSDAAIPNLGLVCHEMQHALGVVEHGAWTSVRPCPYSAREMQQMYGKDRKRKHRRR